MHGRNRLYVTIGLVYGLLGGLLTRASLAVFAARVSPVLWPRAKPRGARGIEIRPAA